MGICYNKWIFPSDISTSLLTVHTYNTLTALKKSNQKAVVVPCVVGLWVRG